jgi:hypothetical protein
MRSAQPLSVCHEGFEKKALHPLPPLDHAFSAQPRVEVDFASDVPPTASTVGDVAGNCAPKPLSPELAVTRIPGWS